jgi:hypothetical protein
MGSPSLTSPPKMNPSYRQTFNRHRVLFSLPIAITTLFAIWFVAGTPKQYKAGASLFVDTKSGQSSLDDPNIAQSTPAARAQQLLTELLTTKHFQGEVGRGTLDQYLARHSSEGWGPTGLLRSLRGGGSVPDRRAKALDFKHVLTMLPGGQVLAIELHGPTPHVAVGTLQALITAFNRQRREIDVSRQQSAMTRYASQMQAAKSALAKLSSQLASGTRSPAEVQGLLQSQRAANTQLRTATRGYNNAAFGLQTAKTEKNSYTVIDAPNLPAPAVSGMKKSVMMVFAGMFVGFLISLLAVVLLTGTESRPAQDELRDVVAQVHDDPVPLDLDSVKTTNGNGSGAHQDAPTKAEHEKRAG